MRSKVWRGAGVGAVLALLLAGGCKHGGPPPGAAGPQGPVPVQVALAEQKAVPIQGSWVATTDGYVNAQIQPQVSGYLIRQDYKEGSVVHKGQVLFEIDPRPLQATLDQAQGQLAQAQAQLALATINVTRDTPLAEARAIARSQLDNDLQTQAADKATVASAQAAVEAAQLNLGFTKVRSLIEGVAGLAQLQVGSLVNTSSTLTSVSQLNPIKVYFAISEQEYLALSADARSRGKSDLLNSGNSIPIHLTLSNNQELSQVGRFIFVDRSVTAQTGTIRVAASFANPHNLIRPGQFGRVTAETQVLEQAILVPQRAVNELQGQQQVILVDANNVAHVRTVTLGPQIGSEVIISGGLKGGDRVVAEGNDKVKDGMKVNPSVKPANGSSDTSPVGQKPQGN